MQPKQRLGKAGVTRGALEVLAERGGAGLGDLWEKGKGKGKACADGAREVFAVALGMDTGVVSSGEGEGLEVLRAWGRDLESKESTSRGEWKQGSTSGLAVVQELPQQVERCLVNLCVH